VGKILINGVSPWDIEPDETSILSIVPFRGRTLIINNTFEDGGNMQLYGMSVENIVSGNKGIRMSGFLAWGLNARLWGWQPFGTISKLHPKWRICHWLVAMWSETIRSEAMVTLK